MALRNLNRSYSGRRICGTPYVGLPGSTIPSTGADGVPPAYPLLTFPADSSVRIRIKLGTIPVGLTLFMFEDTSFIASGADGVYDVHFTLERDGVSNPTDYYFTVTLGETAVTHVAAGALVAAAATLAGTATHTKVHVATGVLVAAAASVSAVARIGIDTGGSGGPDELDAAHARRERAEAEAAQQEEEELVMLITTLIANGVFR